MRVNTDQRVPGISRKASVVRTRGREVRGVRDVTRYFDEDFSFSVLRIISRQVA